MTAESYAKDTAKSVIERVSDLGAAAAASMPGAVAKGLATGAAKPAGKATRARTPRKA